jgi:hypothetical protein
MERILLAFSDENLPSDEARAKLDAPWMYAPCGYRLSGQVAEQRLFLTCALIVHLPIAL